MNVAIIIPALNPDDRLLTYIDDLHRAGEKFIVVVDDGSSDDKKYIFDSIRSKGCIVLRNAINLGKGRTLKNTFNFCLTYFEDCNDNNHDQKIDGVITADSDGQNTVEDILKVKAELTRNPDSLILGARDFSQDNVPPKSAFGNKMTRVIIKLLYGGNITDTQTGLRGLSFDLLPQFLDLFGERFEYETNMLIEALRRNIPIKEVRIATVYENENKGTHFRPLVDSYKIYKLILGTFIRYSLSSISSSIIDLGLFQLLIMLFGSFDVGARVWIATIGARVVSSLYNYAINRNLVFSNKDGCCSTLVKYYILCACQLCASAGIVYLLCTVVGLPEVLIKAIVDTLLFILSFQIQRTLIFNERR